MARWAIIILACLAWLSSTSIAARDAHFESGYQLLNIDHSDQERESEQFQGLQWTEADENLDERSFKLRVVHRDFYSSPFRKTHTTPQELLVERLKRDAARVEALSRRAKMAAQGFQNGDLSVQTASYTVREDTVAGFTGPIVSGLQQGSGEYFTRIGLGTPAQHSYMVLDTGSDISWIQCSPCVDCYTQTGPIFNPRESSTFQRLSCASAMCFELELHGCQAKTNYCLYQVAYGDGSFTTGEFSTETLSFDGATLKSVALGCGHDNEGLFAGAGGILGLGGGSLSFPSQMGVRFYRIFSYCLMDRDRQGSSTLIFGNATVPRGTIFSPLLKNPKLNTFYYVSLTGISVGGSMLTIPASAFKMDLSGNGGVIVDSGTSVTRLVEIAYGPLRSAFRSATASLPSAGGYSLFDTCYSLSNRSAVTVPTVVLHFEGGADVLLPSSNYLIPVDNASTYCFAFASTVDGLSIIGNVQQQGFRVVFDGEGSRLGFAANQC